ncbi:MAG TPA: DNA alkylation repair protein [Anaerolineales bacterium]
MRKPKRENNLSQKRKVDGILARLRSMADPKLLKQEKRLGIDVSQGLGISIWDLRKVAKELGKDQALAEALWQTGIREARLLAGYVADPATISEPTIEAWVADFNSWDIVDQVADVIWLSPYGVKKAAEWSRRPEEFVKRAGFVIMAGLAVEKGTTDNVLENFLPIIAREATDERNFVKKAVNWALRNIGKRNIALNKKAIRTAKQIAEIDNKAAKWIAKDALKELQSEAVQARLKSKKT